MAGDQFHTARNPAGGRIAYLEYVTHDLAQTDPDKAAKEIQRAADRLKEIVAMLPGAEDACWVKVNIAA